MATGVLSVEPWFQNGLPVGVQVIRSTGTQNVHVSALPNNITTAAGVDTYLNANNATDDNGVARSRAAVLLGVPHCRVKVREGTWTFIRNQRIFVDCVISDSPISPGDVP